ncbi:(2Fe-2S)-binding protein [Nocardiopsis sp. LDBS1602]|uniref:(2Fe-2S)-binding protein n=1 Tax=Nocardiopsis sp. LDBS1602 TaxID=3109597 RepID=UPI002DBA227B|nr:(2Fe-2S)-binding protein [Nocardiopsis sp. LDBS1602]MEC3891331.1 (2Fe-2S)-binding protein [Nocardiopsis sp. LDBS1602]
MDCGCDVRREIEGFGPDEGLYQRSPIRAGEVEALVDPVDLEADPCLLEGYPLSGERLERAARAAGFTPRADLDYFLSAHRREPGSVPMASLLADLGRINTFFALESTPPGPGWEPVMRGEPTGPRLAAEVEGVRARIAARFGGRPEDVEWRVAASLFHQSLSSRVLSPVLAAAILYGVRMDPFHLFLRTGHDGPMTLRTIDHEAGPLPDRSPEAIAAWVEATALAGLSRVVHALREVGRISPRLLNGNTSSSLAGAARALAEARPERREVVEAVARRLLEGPSLKGGGGHTEADGHGRPVFRRTTCCLYYRVPNGGKCGDCVLLHRGGFRGLIPS